MGGRNATAQKAFELLAPIAEEHGCELLDVEFVTEGKTRILRLIIDKASGIGLDECSEVSHAAEAVLDLTDMIAESYDLEVSSPGADRPIVTDKDFVRNTGRLVEVLLHTDIGMKNHYEGLLDSFGPDFVEITLDEPYIKGVRPKANGSVMSFDRDNVKLIRRALRF
ncbi:MAG: ribosome maturation factor RimP [Saccharofermentanales bacterium]